MSSAFRAEWTWTPDGLVRGEIVAVDAGGRVVPYAGGPVQEHVGVLVPGFVNAHTHLELGTLATPRRCGLPTWVSMLRTLGAPSAAQAGRGVFVAIRAGTAAVGEISNTGLSTRALVAAHLPARTFHEVFGIDVDAPPTLGADVPGRLTPHAPHSTNPSIIRAAAAMAGPWSIHFDEDPEEALFLKEGRGAWMDFLKAVGRDLRAFSIPALSPAAYLARLDVLDRRALLVHATCTRGADLDRIAGARVCLCVRSNLHITGRLPDVPGMISRGIPLSIGTDSLASSPDLDLLAEAAALRRSFPAIPVETWMRALTEGGADALAMPLGRIREGEAPGLLLVDAPDLASLFDGTPWRRRWLSCPSC